MDVAEDFGVDGAAGFGVVSAGAAGGGVEFAGGGEEGVADLIAVETAGIPAPEETIGGVGESAVLGVG